VANYLQVGKRGNMLKIDRSHVDEVFQHYADEYDQNDIKIKLKVDHTYRVAKMCDAISDSLGMIGLDKDLAFETSAITPEVYEDICSCRSVNRQNSKTGIDFILGHISFVFGLVYPESFRQVKKQGYLKELMDFQSRNPDTAKKMEHIREIVERYIQKQANAGVLAL
jgi:hypothetical protein